MSINIKKYTKDQMAQMVEEAQSAQKEAEDTAATYFEGAKKLREQISKMETQERTLRVKNAALTEQIDQMNGEAINKANEIANLKADADALRVQLKNANDTAEAVSKELQRVNSENDGLRNKLADTEAALGRANTEVARMSSLLERERIARYNAEQRADYAEAHPWRNLWVWSKRKLVRHD